MNRSAILRPTRAANNAGVIHPSRLRRPPSGAKIKSERRVDMFDDWRTFYQATAEGGRHPDPLLGLDGGDILHHFKYRLAVRRFHRLYLDPQDVAHILGQYNRIAAPGTHLAGIGRIVHGGAHHG